MTDDDELTSAELVDRAMDRLLTDGLMIRDADAGTVQLLPAGKDLLRAHGAIDGDPASLVRALLRWSANR